VKIYKSDDGQVRVVDVMTVNGKVKRRAVHYLAMLDVRGDPEFAIIEPKLQTAESMSLTLDAFVCSNCVLRLKFLIICTTI
jgi:hypothetical protein